MAMPRIMTADEAAALVPDGAVVTVSSSSGLGLPRCRARGARPALRRLGPSARPDDAPPHRRRRHVGHQGIDHIAKDGMLRTVIAGSYPSGPSSATPPAIWQMVSGNAVAAYNIPSGILFDMHRDAAAHRPGVLTKVGLDTFVDPDRQGCAMNARAAASPVVSKVQFAGDTWLFFPAIVPQVAIIRATTADERGNLSYEHEGGYLGPLDQALAVRNNGGIVIAQVKRLAQSGTLKPHDVLVPGILVDAIVVAPDQMQTTQTVYEPAISGEVFRPLSSFEIPAFDVSKVIARRVAQELRHGDAVNIGFGISANVPRILIEEGLHGAVTWSSSRAPSAASRCWTSSSGARPTPSASCRPPTSSPISRAGGFDASLLSFLQIDQDGCVNVSKLGVRPHVTAGAGGFVDITARARKIVFSGFFSAAADLAIENEQLTIRREGKVKKLVTAVEHVSFSGRRAVRAGAGRHLRDGALRPEAHPRRSGGDRGRSGRGSRP